MRLLRKIFGSSAEIHIEYKQNYSGSTGVTKSMDFDLSEAPGPWDKETTTLEGEDENLD